MKNFKILMALSLMLIKITVFAQSNTDLIAVVTKASWCPACKANDERVMTEVLSQMKDPAVSIAVYDLSDKNTVEASQNALKKLGVLDVISDDRTTGQITFIDAKSKKIVDRVSITKSSEELKKAFEKALSEVG